MKLENLNAEKAKKTFNQKRNEFINSLNEAGIEYNGTLLSRYCTINKAVGLFDIYKSGCFKLNQQVDIECFICINEMNITKMRKDFRKALKHAREQNLQLLTTENEFVFNAIKEVFNNVINN